ncbi:MAG: HNH endonuclease family protein [Candidatus Saccharimonadales bacterium]
MRRIYRVRQVVTLLIVLAIIISANQVSLPWVEKAETPAQEENKSTILAVLATLPVKGRAPKTDYRRVQFGKGWVTMSGCDMRNIILARDLESEKIDTKCHVLSGVLNDPYTGSVVQFLRGPTTSEMVQIDHVVALSNAWQTGAQQLTAEQREAFANDPLNLLAVDGRMNQVKSDADAATWLPPQKTFRCQYIERQLKVKQKYSLWVTPAEKAAIERVAVTC